MGLFDPRTALKPFEYDVGGFKEAIQHSYWLATEYNYDADIHDFRASMGHPERNAIKNTLLAISQIEVAVKKFWGRLGDRFPKPEIEQVGAVFSESEVRHADAYSHLLQVLGLNEEFDALLRDSEAVRGRVEYLAKYLKSSPQASNRDFSLTLALFTVLVENASLFSQFAIIQSYWKKKRWLKGVDNVVQATRKEETVHALFGAHLFRLMMNENPDWMDAGLKGSLTKACKKAAEAESAIIDWIFEAGDVSFIPRDALKDYVRHRLNRGMDMLGLPPVFSIPRESIDQFAWFDEEELAEVCVDFFHKVPVSYSKKKKSVKKEDLF